MKFSPDRPYSDPEKAARKILEIANAVEAVQDGRIHIEKINGPFLFRERGNAGRIQGWSGSGDRARLAGACTRAVRSSAFTQTGADLLRVNQTSSGALSSSLASTLSF